MRLLYLYETMKAYYKTCKPEEEIGFRKAVQLLHFHLHKHPSYNQMTLIKNLEKLTKKQEEKINQYKRQLRIIDYKYKALKDAVANGDEVSVDTQWDDDI
jgi:hypothetical protein